LAPLATRSFTRWYLALAAVSLAGVVSYNFLPIEQRHRAAAFVALQLLLLAPAAGALWLRPGGRIPLAVILGAAALVRLACLPSDLIFENDVFRYLWDGRVWAAHLNPYQHAPSSPELAGLVDEWLFPQIAYRQVPTPYPPLAEALFAGARGLFGEDVLGLQAIMAAFDLGTVVLLVLLGRALAVPRAAAAYALHPLVLKEFSQAAHVDAAAVFFLVLAALLMVRKRNTWAVSCLAAATLVKMFPIVLLPVLGRRVGWKRVLLYGALVFAPFAVLLAMGVWPFTGLETFARYWIFNPSVYDLVVRAIGLIVPIERAHALARPVCALVIAGGIARLTWKVSPGDDRSVLRAMLAAILLLLLCSPAANPWYVAWLLPFGLLLGDRAALAWTGTASLAYLFYWAGADLPASRVVEYAPVFALLALGAWRRRRRDHAGQSPSPEV